MAEVDAAEYTRLLQIMVNLVGMEPSASDKKTCVNAVAEFLKNKKRLDEVASAVGKYLENPPKNPTQHQVMTLNLAKSFSSIYENAERTFNILKTRDTLVGKGKYIPSSDVYSK